MVFPKRIARHPRVPFMYADGAGVRTVVVPVVRVVPVDPVIAVHVFELVVTAFAALLLLPVVSVRGKMAKVRTVVRTVVVMVVQTWWWCTRWGSIPWWPCPTWCPIIWTRWGLCSGVSRTSLKRLGRRVSRMVMYQRRIPEVRTMKGGRRGLRQASLLRRQRGHKGEPRMCAPFLGSIDVNVAVSE